MPDRVEITLNLPQELVERAQSAGLLTEAQVERWLTEELARQQKVDRLFGNLDRLAALEPPLSPEEIEAEIDAYRREKRQHEQGDAS